MRPVRALWLALFVVGLVALSRAAGITNGDFETGTATPPSGWTAFPGLVACASQTWSSAALTPHGGTQSAVSGGTACTVGTGPTGLQQAITTVVGQQYIFYLYARGTMGDVVNLYIDGALKGTLTQPNTANYNLVKTSAFTATSTTHTFAFAAPGGVVDDVGVFYLSTDLPSVTHYYEAQTGTSFSYTAAGAVGTVSSQWTKNGGNVATTATYTLATPITSASNEGNTVQVIVTDSTLGNIASITSTVHVFTISTQPQAAHVVVGGSNTFTVSFAQNVNAPTFQWTKNGANTATTQNYNFGPALAGDDGAQFKVTLSDSGIAGSSVVSNTVALTVTHFTQDLSATSHSIVGGTVTYTVAVGSAVNTLSYSWETSTDGGANWVAATGATNSVSYSFTAAAGNNNAKFRVTVTEASVGTFTSTVTTLTVTSITTDLSATSHAAAGGTVTYTVVVSNAVNALTYTWQKSTDGGANWSAAPGAMNNPSYSFTAAAGDNTAKFRVQVSEAMVSPPVLTSTVTTLSVFTVSTITANPVSKIIAAPNQISFSVTPSNNVNALTYAWTLAGAAVGTNQNTYTLATTAGTNDGNVVQVSVTESMYAPPQVQSVTITVVSIATTGGFSSVNPSMGTIGMTNYIVLKPTGNTPTVTVKGTGFNTAVWTLTGDTAVTHTMVAPATGDNYVRSPAFAATEAGKTLSVQVYNSGDIAQTVSNQATIIWLAGTASSDRSGNSNTYYVGETMTFTVNGGAVGSSWNQVNWYQTIGGVQTPIAGCQNVALMGTTATCQISSVPITYDQAQIVARMYHTSNAAVTLDSNAVTVTVFNGVITNTQVIFVTTNPSTAGNTGTFSVTLTGGGTAPMYSYAWEVRTTLTGMFAATSPAQTGSSITVAANPNGVNLLADHQYVYRLKLTLNGITQTTNTGSLQVIKFSFPTTPHLYDYYAGATVIPPNAEPSFAQPYKADNLRPLDNNGNQVAAISCTLTLYDSANTAVDSSTATADTINPTYNIAATAPTAMPCSYDKVVLLNQGYMKVVCGAATYGASGPITVYYPPKAALTPTALWTHNPVGFGLSTGANAYTFYPEPGHWNYRSQQDVTFNFIHDGNPTVKTLSILTFSVSSPAPPSVSATAPPAAGVTVSAVVALSNSATPSGTWSIGAAAAPLSIDDARTKYWGKFLAVTAAFPTAGLSGFTKLWQPLYIAGSLGPNNEIDNGILLPHFPPVMNSAGPLQSQQGNFPDTAVYTWTSNNYLLFDGYPKQDSNLGNSLYAKANGMLNALQRRNYDQRIEFLTTLGGTAYDTKYQASTSSIAPAQPTITTVQVGTTGIFNANSVITPTTTTPFYQLNKWVYRWVLGVYKVDGSYETYVDPATMGFTYSLYTSTYTYHTISAGFIGIWNWYPREFVPSACPSFQPPFAVGATTATVIPSNKATMYPSPDASVLSWAYSHQTAGPTYRIDASIAATTLSGAQTGMTGSNTALLPSVPGVTHTFYSTYTVTIRQIPSYSAFPQPPYPTQEVLDYTVDAKGQINTILSSDANSIIATQYTHTLPDLQGTTKGTTTTTAYPWLVLVNNCNNPTTLTTTAATINHRGGETIVVTFPRAQATTPPIDIQTRDPNGGTFAVTVASVAVSTTGPVTVRFTTKYSSAGAPLTQTEVKLSATYTPFTMGQSVTAYVYEYSNLPGNYPFATGGAPLNPTNMNNVATSRCQGVNTVTDPLINAAAKSSQYLGCGTSTPYTSPNPCTGSG